jgi:GNAT superfamily N-acetyltransferase
MIEYRWMEGKEACEWLNGFLEHKGWTMLNEFTARALCAMENGRVVGFYVLQLFPHAEPLYVDPEYRGTGISDKLADLMHEYLKEARARGYMVIADNPLAAKMCEAHGMKRVTAPVYIGSEA